MNKEITSAHRRLSWRGVVALVGVVLGTVVQYMNLPQEAYAMTGMPAPEITSSAWINSGPQSLRDLRGKVVLVEFWTFGCYNCRNVEPQVKQWHQQYADRGFVVISIHSPEFAYEKDIDAVTRYVRDHGIRYVVAVDNDFVNWNRFGNRYWPAMYLVDKRGVVRYVRVGEGGYDQTQRVIEALLKEGFSHEAPKN
ncbi:MAG: redoxin domain-containing protein [Nitrospira sp.]|nr:redoxin domain-containing protein [Nitrospira sp.]